jgi:predicted transcriptional regulator
VAILSAFDDDSECDDFGSEQFSKTRTATQVRTCHGLRDYLSSSKNAIAAPLTTPSTINDPVEYNAIGINIGCLKFVRAPSR